MSNSLYYKKYIKYYNKYMELKTQYHMTGGTNAQVPQGQTKIIIPNKDQSTLSTYNNIQNKAPVPSARTTEGGLLVLDGSSGNKNQLYYRDAGKGINIKLCSMQVDYLYYDDINFSDAKTSLCQYNETKTRNNGKVTSYINSDGLISFSGISNCLLEFYVNVDVASTQNLTNNFIKFDLLGVSTEKNTLSTVNIDTRSISRNNKAPITFGPTIYKLIDKGDVSSEKKLCISNANTYKLRCEVGKEYTLTDIKLIIKVVYT